MAHVIADRVADVSTSTGTGSIAISGSPPPGFQTLSAVLSNADTFYVCISHQSLTEWEVSLSAYNGGNAFTRTTVIASSNGGVAVNFSAGAKDVFLVQPAARDNPRLFGVTDNELVRFDGTTGNLQGTGIIVDDTTKDMAAPGNIQLTNGSALRAASSSGNTLLLQARDVDGSAWTTAVRLTSGDTPTFELVSLDLDTNGRAILFDDNTGIKDDSGNKLLIFQKTASAVNHVEITNAATGNDVSIAAAGSDADVGLNLVTKGSGAVKVNGAALPTVGVAAAMAIVFG